MHSIALKSNAIGGDNTSMKNTTKVELTDTAILTIHHALSTFYKSQVLGDPIAASQGLPAWALSEFVSALPVCATCGLKVPLECDADCRHRGGSESDDREDFHSDGGL